MSIGKMKQDKVRKCLAVFIAWIEMLFFSGIVYGMNSLFPVLKKEKLFLEFCKSSNVTEPCPEQTKLLGYIIVTAVASQSLVAVPIGIFFDRFGQRWTKMIAAISFLVGCLFFFFFTKASLLVYLYAASLAITTQCLITCNMSLSNLFPTYQNRIVSVMSGSIDTSSVILTIVSISYFGGVSLFSSILALGFSGFAIMMFSSIVFLGYIDKYFAVKSPKTEVNVSLLEGEEGANDIVLEKIENNLNEEENVNNDLKKDYLNPKNRQIYAVKLQETIVRKYPTLCRAIFSRQYLLQLSYFIIIFFRFSFFLAQLGLQIGHHFPTEEAKVNHLLYVSSFFFMCGMLFSPFAGLIVDCFKQRLVRKCRDSQPGTLVYAETLKCFVLPLIICGASNLMMSVFIMVPRDWAVYFSYALFTLTRAFLFSINSSYILQAFPAKFFGKLLGGAILFSGLISFIQYALLFQNPEYMAVVNYVLIFLSCLTFAHPLVLCLKSRQKARNDI